MKIYKVLKEITPFLNVGTVQEPTLQRNFTDYGIKMLLINKYIEEPKKEFTQDDMIDCVNEIVLQYVQDKTMIPCMANFRDGIKAKVEDWKKSRS